MRIERYENREGWRDRDMERRERGGEYRGRKGGEDGVRGKDIQSSIHQQLESWEWSTRMRRTRSPTHFECFVADGPVL
jgi:hypothetical protein